MRRLSIIFTVIVLCFIVSCLLFGAKETVYFLGNGYVRLCLIVLVVLAGYFLTIFLKGLSRKRNDPE